MCPPSPATATPLSGGHQRAQICPCPPAPATHPGGRQRALAWSLYVHVPAPSATHPGGHQRALAWSLYVHVPAPPATHYPLPPTQVATSVLEEGLDVPACDAVVRFDNVESLRAYVQSRGRVRHKVRGEQTHRIVHLLWAPQGEAAADML